MEFVANLSAAFPTWGGFPESLWAPLAGGILIGLAAVTLMAVNGRIAGIAGIASRLLPPFDRDGETLGRALFLLGLIGGPAILLKMGVFVDVASPGIARPWLILAGLLVGFGTVLGSGCTSGHGVCGLARLSPRSLLATLGFMAVAMTTVFVLRHVIGG